MKELLIIILFIQISMSAQNGQKNFIDQNYIEVIGKIETKITPNEIYLTIIINENNKRANSSVEQQEKIMLNILESVGVDLEKQLSIIDFMGNYNKHIFKKNGVSKNKEYQLVVYDTDSLGKIFESLDEINISNVLISKVDHSDIEQFRKGTKLKALNIAKEKAKNYVDIIDQTLGKAIFIKEINGNHNTVNYNNELNEVVLIRGYSSNSYKNIRTPKKLSFKKIEIIASVLVRFELK